jgi:hypothetical protein
MGKYRNADASAHAPAFDAGETEQHTRTDSKQDLAPKNNILNLLDKHMFA